MDNLTDDELKEIAKQLRCPSGIKGDEVSEIMEETNSSMILTTIEHLDLKMGDILFELGPGNGYHLGELIEKCKQVYAVDISKLMIEKIKSRYKKEIEEKKLIPLVGDGKNINISKGAIDKGFTVNTIYFWEEPKRYLCEISECFRPGGEFIITYAHKRFIETMPFTQYGFNAYDEEQVESLCKETSFSIISQTSKIETVNSKIGKTVQREFIVARLKKD